MSPFKTKFSTLTYWPRNTANEQIKAALKRQEDVSRVAFNAAASSEFSRFETRFIRESHIPSYHPEAHLSLWRY